MGPTSSPLLARVCPSNSSSRNIHHDTLGLNTPSLIYASPMYASPMYASLIAILLFPRSFGA